MRRDVPTYDPRNARSPGGGISGHVIYLIIISAVCVLASVIYGDLRTAQASLLALEDRLQLQIELVSEVGTTSVSQEAYSSLNVELEATIREAGNLGLQLKQAESKTGELRAQISQLELSVQNKNESISQLKQDFNDLKLSQRQEITVEDTKQLDLTRSDSQSESLTVVEEIESKYVPPILKERFAPVYPRRALTRGREGSCEIKFFVLVTGKPQISEVKCSPSDIGFEKSSTTAVESFSYEPAYLDESPVLSRLQSISFSFDLD